MRRLLAAAIAICVMSASSGAFASNVQLQDLFVEAPSGWTLHQSANADGTLILGFAKGDDYVTFYAKQGSQYEMKSIFASKATVLAEDDKDLGALKWRVMEARRDANAAEGTKTVHVASFSGQRKGYTYLGYSRSSDRTTAMKNVTAFLERTMIFLGGMRAERSLTNHDYTGKKYYFGWGAAGGSDPQMMHNEVKYDVLHTHDIFTAKVGGDYEGRKLFSTQAKASEIRSEWARMKSTMKDDDMYVQYSSGHGSPSGLAVGVSYTEIRDAVLAMDGKEKIVFIMACHSGGLVEQFDQVKSQWKDYPSQGRTLFVMASSTKSQTSSTGPGTDPDQAGGPHGSAGSAYGHALWKALIGYADGYVDGVKDEFLSLEEIRDFTVWKTKKVGGHSPVHTGAYNGNLIMNRIPSKEFLARLEGSSENLSDEELVKKIQALDAELRITRQ